MIKTIKLNIVIEYDDKICRHNFIITKFLFRKLHIVYKNKLYLKTKTELLKWLGCLMCDVK
jgi:hypothetical protein